jgi:hypothetical protein
MPLTEEEIRRIVREEIAEALCLFVEKNPEALIKWLSSDDPLPSRSKLHPRK